MNISLFPLRRVKYRPLRHLLKRQVTISSCDQIEGDVLAAVNSAISEGFRLASSLNDVEIVLGKYGFLDLDFVIERDLLMPADRIDRNGIRDLGYSPRPPDPPEMDADLKKELGDDRGCLEVLMESVKEETTHLSIFLNSNYSRDAMTRHFDEVQLQHARGVRGVEGVTAAVFSVAEKMKRNFPITFTIEDACLSNSDAIWLAKHVYL